LSGGIGRGGEGKVQALGHGLSPTGLVSGFRYPGLGLAPELTPPFGRATFRVVEVLSKYRAGVAQPMPR
jgi:hypothetical protein